MLSASIWSEIAALLTSNCLTLTGHVFDRVALADPIFKVHFSYTQKPTSFSHINIPRKLIFQFHEGNPETG